MSSPDMHHEISHEGMGQPEMITQLEQLSDKKGNKREDLPGGTTKVETREGEKIKIERIEHSTDPRVKGSHDLLVKTFGRGEVDSIGTIRTAIEGRVVGDEKTLDTPLLVTIVEKNGEVVATAHSAVLGALNENFDGKPEGSFILDAYTAVRKGERGKGLGLELYRKRLMDAMEHAALGNIKVTSVVAEVDPEDPEKFYNSVGLRRLYYENNDGKLVEVPYFQSVLADAWDKDTGKPLEGNEAMALHLMVAQLDQRNELTVEEVLEKVRSLMDYDSFQTEGYFRNKGAHKAHEKILEKDLSRLEKALKEARHGKIKLFTEAERTAWKSTHGTDSIIEHAI